MNFLDKLASCKTQNISRGMFASVPPDALSCASGFSRAAMPQYLTQISMNKMASLRAGFMSELRKLAEAAGEAPLTGTPVGQAPQPSGPSRPPPPPMRRSDAFPSADATTAASRSGAIDQMSEKIRSGLRNGFPGMVAPHGALTHQ